MMLFSTKTLKTRCSVIFFWLQYLSLEHDLCGCLQMKLSRFLNIWGEVSLLLFLLCEINTTILKKLSILLSSPICMPYNYLEPLGHFSSSNWPRTTFKYVLFNFCHWQNEILSVTYTRRIGPKTICPFIVIQKTSLFPFAFASLTRWTVTSLATVVEIPCSTVSEHCIVMMDTMFPWEQNILIRLQK